MAANAVQLYNGLTKHITVASTATGTFDLVALGFAGYEVFLIGPETVPDGMLYILARATGVVTAATNADGPIPLGKAVVYYKASTTATLSILNASTGALDIFLAPISPRN